MLKKAIIALVGASLLLTGCSKNNVVVEEPTATVESTTYMLAGRYYTSGTVITEDGNMWGYSQDIISEKPSYDNEPVYALINDMGTPDNIYDDEVLGCVRDTATAIMDDLEVALSEDFSVERDGNEIKLGLK